MGTLYPTFKEGLMSILLTFFQKIEEEKTLPNSSYEISITIIPKPRKHTTARENCKPISLMNINPENLTKTPANQIRLHVTRNTPYD